MNAPQLSHGAGPPFAWHRFKYQCNAASSNAVAAYATCCLSSVILWAIKILFICKAHIKMFSPGSPLYVGNFVESLARLPELWLLVRAVAKFPMAFTALPSWSGVIAVVVEVSACGAIWVNNCACCSCDI